MSNQVLIDKARALLDRPVLGDLGEREHELREALDQALTALTLRDQEVITLRSEIATVKAFAAGDTDKILVPAEALEGLLRAVLGPPHYIRELQVTREVDATNPITILRACWSQWKLTQKERAGQAAGSEGC